MRFSFLRILLPFFCFAAAAFAAGTPEYVLRELGEGEVEISEYRGNASSVDVPASVEGRRVVSVGAWAFAGRSSLRKVFLPSSLREIGEGAFANCTELERVGFPAALRKIGARAFFGCAKLADVDLEYQFVLEEVGQEAFALCSSLKSGSVRLAGSPRAGRNAFPPGVSVASAELPKPPVVAPPPRPTFPSVDEPPRNPAGTNSGKYVLIFANEKYDRMSSVAYAERDGAAFRDYCVATLGIPSDHVEMRKNASAREMRRQINIFAERGARAKRTGRDVEYFVYYAGHGVPFGRTEKSCLLPCDESATDPDPAFELGEIYRKLGGSGAKTVTFFIDACFCGADRDGTGDGRLARAAPAETPSALPPNVAVFSAAALDQSAWGLPEQKHGVFTYALLKKLKEARGNVSYEELRDALVWDVPETAQAARGVSQDASGVFGEAFPKTRRLQE